MKPKKTKPQMVKCRECSVRYDRATSRGGAVCESCFALLREDEAPALPPVKIGPIPADTRMRFIPGGSSSVFTTLPIDKKRGRRGG